MMFKLTAAATVLLSLSALTSVLAAPSPSPAPVPEPANALTARSLDASAAEAEALFARSLEAQEDAQALYARALFMHPGFHPGYGMGHLGFGHPGLYAHTIGAAYHPALALRAGAGFHRMY